MTWNIAECALVKGQRRHVQNKNYAESAAFTECYPERLLLTCNFSEFTLTICGRRYLLDSSTLAYSLQKPFSSRVVGYVDRIKQSCWVICQQQNWGVEGREVALSQCDKITWWSWIFTATIPIVCAIPGCQKQGFHLCEEKNVWTSGLWGLSQTKHQLSQNLWPRPAAES